MARQPNTVRIPTVALSETRAAFTDYLMVYEMDFRAEDPWRGLQFVAEQCARAGFELHSLRCSTDGRIACRVGDRDARVEDFARQIAGNDCAELAGWTSIVTFQESPA